jgi:hypothetical protein
LVVALFRFAVYCHAGNFIPSLLTHNAGTNGLNAWNHFSVTFNNKQPTLYINGVVRAFLAHCSLPSVGCAFLAR